MRLFPKRETAFTGEFVRDLKAAFGDSLWLFKVHGHEMQAKGVPDVVCCINGLFVGIEFKIRRGSVNITPYQKYTKECIEKANGFSFIVWFDEATAVVGIDELKFNDRKEAIKFLLARFKP